MTDTMDTSPVASSSSAPPSRPDGADFQLPKTLVSKSMDTTGDDLKLIINDEDDMDIDSGSKENNAYLRDRINYKPQYQKFMLKRKVFTQQFSHIYLKRLVELKGPLKTAVVGRSWKVTNNKENNNKELKLYEKTIDFVKNDNGIIIGTIFKVQKLKQDIIEQYANEFNGKALSKTLENYCSEGDSLVLEDESGRVELLGLSQEFINSIPTGVVMAIHGRLEASGDLTVINTCFAGLPKQTITRAPKSPAKTKPKYLLLCSSLFIGKKDHLLATQLLVDYITGQAGCNIDQEVESEIVRVMIAGSSVLSEEIREEDIHFDDPLTTDQQTKLVQPLKTLDMMVAEMCSSVNVDIMAGVTDPSNFSLPQQPLNKCLFPFASRFNSFKRVTNPYECILDGGEGGRGGVRVLGHSGQPVQDVLKYTQGMSEIDVLEHSLSWRHMAPTAPDTLSCYPDKEKDVFLISDCPHLYFSGDCESFASRLVRGSDGQMCRLVAVPKFSKTGIAVLVDLSSETLRCSQICFSSN